MTTQEITALVLSFAIAAILIMICLKMRSLFKRNPRPAEWTRQAYGRHIRSLTEYRNFLPMMRLGITAMGICLLAQVLIDPGPVILNWIVSGIAVISAGGAWIVDRHPPDATDIHEHEETLRPNSSHT